MAKPVQASPSGSIAFHGKPNGQPKPIAYASAHHTSRHPLRLNNVSGAVLIGVRRQENWVSFDTELSFGLGDR